MSDFEREIVNCLNRYFKKNNLQGFAFRLKPQKTGMSCADVLADSPDPAYNLSIECKSIIDTKLYFSQHFHSDKQGLHPVDAIADFLAKSGRTGYLAIEFRQPPGKENRAFLIPWGTVVEHFRKNQGISISDPGKYREFGRSREGYILEDL
jgi:Holliday junction resolvase